MTARPTLGSTSDGSVHDAASDAAVRAARSASASPAGATRRGAASFYPPQLAQQARARVRVARVSTIEINGSFYSLQRPEYYARWRDETPDDFVFSVKGAALHHAHAAGCAMSSRRSPTSSPRASRTCGDKLGPVLWQLPPTLRASTPSALERSLALLPRDTDAAAALARRHDDKVAGPRGASIRRDRGRCATRSRCATTSFVDPAFVALLRRHGVALVVADTRRQMAAVEDVTADFVYLRLHGDESCIPSGYAARARRAGRHASTTGRRGGQPADARLVVAARSAPAPAPRDVYCYFDNDQKALAPRDAQSLARILGVCHRRDGGPRRRGTPASGKIRIGISGWRYAPWRGVFYPKGLPQRARARVRVAPAVDRSRSTARSTRCSARSTTRSGATRRRTISCSASRAAASSRTC